MTESTGREKPDVAKLQIAIPIRGHFGNSQTLLSFRMQRRSIAASQRHLLDFLLQ